METPFRNSAGRRLASLAALALAAVAGCGPRETADSAAVPEYAFITNGVADFWTISKVGAERAAADLVHFTGYERPVASITMPNLNMRLIGYLLGSADIIAQMADRCYLEKCRDRLYPEFVAGGIAKMNLPNGDSQVIFSSGDDLVMKTPKFYAGASRRLNGDLQGLHTFAGKHFGGQQLYQEEIDKNIKFAEMVGKEQDTSVLRRTLPDTLAPETGPDKA